MPVVAESSIELSDEMDINDEIFNDVKILDSDSDSDLDNTENNSSAYGNKKSILRNPVASRKSTRDRKPTVQFDASSKSKQYKISQGGSSTAFFGKLSTKLVIEKNYKSHDYEKDF